MFLLHWCGILTVVSGDKYSFVPDNTDKGQGLGILNRFLFRNGCIKKRTKKYLYEIALLMFLDCSSLKGTDNGFLHCINKPV